MTKEALTPLLATSLDSQELAKHRALVAFELEVLAKKHDRFGWDRDRGTATQDRLITDWMNALQNYTLAEIQKACGEFTSEFPDKAPNEGHIRKIIIANRKKEIRSLPKPPEPEREPAATKEQAAKILRDAGVTLNKYGGIERL